MRKTVRLLSLLLVMALVVSMLPAVFAYGDASSWAKKELDRMEELGLIPASMEEAESLKVPATRGQMCELLVLAYETYTGAEIEPEELEPFTDTDDVNIAKAYSLGIVNGYSDGTFGPEDILARDQFCAMTYRLLNVLGIELESDAYDIEFYLDRSSVAKWSRDAVQAMVRFGVLQGSAGYLKLKDAVTCEQSLILVCRVYERMMEDAFVNRERLAGASKWAVKTLTTMDEAGFIPNLVLFDDMSAKITRREMCYVAVRTYYTMMGMTFDETRPTPFADVNDPVITAAYYLGIMNGYGDGRFGPNDLLTREQLYTITLNFLSVNFYNRIDAPNADMSQFRDWDQVSKFAQAATRLLVDMGIVKGSGTELMPKEQADRQTALMLFYRSYEALEEWMLGAITPDPDPTDPEDPDPTEPDPPHPSEPSELGQRIADYALRFVGYKYQWGGKDPSTGFDCSGLVWYVYHQFDIPMYRVATDQWFDSDGVRVSTSDLQPGDLLFFSDDGGASMFHVAIYIGNNQYVHAANSNRGVVVDTMNWTSGSWFAKNYYGAKRFI